MPKKFSQEYKAEAVKLVTEGGLSNQQVAEDLGIGMSTMQKWVRERAQSKIQVETLSALSESEKEELKRLRKEVTQLRMERDFLKKTANYFAKTVL
jgi:transposase